MTPCTCRDCMACLVRTDFADRVQPPHRTAQGTMPGVEAAVAPWVAVIRRSAPFARPWGCDRCGAAANEDCRYVYGAPMAGDLGPEIHVERVKAPVPREIEPEPEPYDEALQAAFDRFAVVAKEFGEQWFDLLMHGHATPLQQSALDELRALVAETETSARSTR